MPNHSGSSAGSAASRTITGTAGNNTLVGSNLADRLFGLGGRDILTAKAGNDALFGGAGADQLYGGSGSDTLMGGRGRDALSGGAGADVFVFDDKDTGDASSGRADVITDLSGNDVIDLREVDILYLDSVETVSPQRGGLSVWEARGSTYLSWNTFGEMHDIEVRGYEGSMQNLLDQVHWYDDDNFGTIGTTATIRAGQTRTGTLEVPDDEDWFRIELVAGKVYNFTTEGKADGFGTARDLRLVLHNENGYELDDDWSAGSFPFLAEQSGTYFLAVHSDANMNDASYRLRVTSKVYADDYGDDLESATRLAVDSSRTGVIELREDADAFEIRVKEGKTYQLDLAGRPNAEHALSDPYLEMVNEWWDDIAIDDDSGPGLASRITFTAEETATYYLGVTDAAGGFGSYRISFAEIDPI